MTMAYPSVEDLRTLLADIQKQTTYRKVEVQRLMRRYFNPKVSHAEVRRAITHFIGQNEVTSQALLQRYRAWRGLRVDDETSEADYLNWRLREGWTHLILDELPSLEHIRLVGLLLYSFEEEATALPGVREVFTFLRVMTLDQRASTAQQRAASDAWQRIMMLAGPQRREAGHQSSSIRALVTLREILKQYDKDYPVVRAIVPRHKAHEPHDEALLKGRAHNLHAAFPHVTERDFLYLLRQGYDAGYITRVVVERHFHLVSKETESIRQTLRRARLDQKRQHP